MFYKNNLKFSKYMFRTCCVLKVFNYFEFFLNYMYPCLGESKGKYFLKSESKVESYRCICIIVYSILRIFIPELESTCKMGKRVFLKRRKKFKFIGLNPIKAGGSKSMYSLGGVWRLAPPLEKGFREYVYGWNACFQRRLFKILFVYFFILKVPTAVNWCISLSNHLIYKVVISVCLIITWEPLDRFASNFDWGTRETHGNVLAWFWDPKLSGSTLIAKFRKFSFPVKSFKCG